MAALQLLGMERRPEASPEGPREAGIGQRRGCRDRAPHARGRPHPASGSHLPAEGTAPPCAVAFRVVAPCPAPQKPYTSPRPTTGFRLNLPYRSCKEKLTRVIHGGKVVTAARIAAVRDLAAGLPGSWLAESATVRSALAVFFPCFSPLQFPLRIHVV